MACNIQQIQNDAEKTAEYCQTLINAGKTELSLGLPGLLKYCQTTIDLCKKLRELQDSYDDLCQRLADTDTNLDRTEQNPRPTENEPTLFDEEI